MLIDLKKLLPEEGPFTFEQGCRGQTVFFMLNGGELRAELYLSDHEWSLEAMDGANKLNAGGMFDDDPSSLAKTEITLRSLCDTLIHFPSRLVQERTWPYTLRKLQVYKDGDWKDLIITRSRNRLRGGGPIFSLCAL